MGDEIPLKFNDDFLPSSSTLFKPIQTVVYHPSDDVMKLDSTVLKHCKDKSEKLAEDKERIVKVTWHYFFNRVAEDIQNHNGLQKLLFETQGDFYKETVVYKEFSDIKW